MWSRRALAAIVPLCVAAVLAGAPRDATGAPQRRFWTIETDHFVIHYYDPLEDVARRVAAVAERAHQVMAPALRRFPRVKTQVFLLDDTDGANGFASVLPRNRITLFATAPIGESGLNDHDDWLYLLTTHEYTHILHLDSIGGLPVWVNKILGKTWAPNQIQPRWVIEGFATYQESKRSAAGRTRSSQFDMVVRVAALAGEDLGLDEVTGGPFRFPRGNAAYLYGSKFLQYVFDREGDDAGREMSWAGGRNFIPYGVNRQIHEATGEPFTELWDDWKAWLRDRYTVQLEAIERDGVREGRRLTFDTEGHRAPEYSADGRELYWLANDGVSRIRLRALPVGGNVGDAREVTALDRVGRYALLPDGAVVYEQTQQFQRIEETQDLMLWDPVTGATTRLTTGARAREPHVSPDGRWVAYSRNAASQSTLAVMPLAPQEVRAAPRILWQGGRWDQAFQPAWSPDGDRIAFSAWRQGGYRDILIVDVASGEVTEIARDRALDGDPAWSPDGTYLFFSSDRTGIYNVYAHDVRTGELWQVTNVVGGAFDPAVSPDGRRLAYVGFDVGGNDLYELELDPARWTPARPYVDDRPPPTDVADDEVRILAKRRYRPIETLGPQAWQAELTANTAIGTAVTVRTGGGDIVGLHGWSLGVTVGLETGRANIGGSYVWNGGYLPVRIAAGRSVADRTGYRVDGESRPYEEEVVQGTLAVGVPTRRSASGSVTISGDLDVDHFRLVDEPDDPPDPSELLPRRPTSDYTQVGLALRGSWSNVRGFAESLGPTEGHDASASLRLDHPALGARFRGLTLNWSYRSFWRIPWGETPVLAVRYAGGARVNDRQFGPAFALGSVPEQDIVTAILSEARFGSTGYLRGYEPRALDGDVFHLANLEYRHRLWQVEQGIATLPVYVRRLHVAALLDAGTAYDDEITRDDVKWSIGGAVRLDGVLGYFAPGSLEVGHARGLSTDGINETWVLLTTNL